MDKTPTAWMLRHDGKEFPCACHYYGSKEDAEETLYAAEWLYGATESAQTRQSILALVAAYGISLNPHRNLIRNLYIDIKEKPYLFLSYDFVRSHANELSVVDFDRLNEMNLEVIHRLNNEFLRVRLGGMYDTEQGNRDLYCRISGAEFDRLPQIRAFVKKHAADIDTVTVLWDLESTGHSEFLTDETGRTLEHIPLQEFVQ